MEIATVAALPRNDTSVGERLDPPKIFKKHCSCEIVFTGKEVLILTFSTAPPKL